MGILQIETVIRSAFGVNETLTLRALALQKMFQVARNTPSLQTPKVTMSHFLYNCNIQIEMPALKKQFRFSI